mgnify:CR=1 FL=1
MIETCGIKCNGYSFDPLTYWFVPSHYSSFGTLTHSIWSTRNTKTVLVGFASRFRVGLPLLFDVYSLYCFLNPVVDFVVEHVHSLNRSSPCFHVLGRELSGPTCRASARLAQCSSTAADSLRSSAWTVGRWTLEGFLQEVHEYLIGLFSLKIYPPTCTDYFSFAQNYS